MVKRKFSMSLKAYLLLLIGIVVIAATCTAGTIGKKDRNSDHVTHAMASVRQAAATIIDEGMDSLEEDEGFLSYEVGLDVFCIDQSVPVRTVAVPTGVDGYYNERLRVRPLRYLRTEEAIIITSIGPDRVPSLDSETLRRLNGEEIENYLRISTYEPTNGTVSPGDIVKVIGRELIAKN